mgnify:CR=1 FL=1
MRPNTPWHDRVGALSPAPASKQPFLPSQHPCNANRAKLVEQLGGEVVKVVFLMELVGLKGRERLNGYDVASVICYDGK